MSLVKVYGPLADFVGQKEFHADINTAAESIRMLLANFPGLEGHMCSQDYQIIVDEEEFGLEDLDRPVGKGDISIVPVVLGAGNTGKIIAGIALVGLVIWSGGIGGSLAAGFKFQAGKLGGAWVASTLTSVGAYLTLSGVAGLLTPTPEIPDISQDPRVDKSFNFSGIQNTSTAGVPVPVVMGLTLPGSVVISAGIDTVQVEAT